jgi:ribonuclease BN (tRNA processing enzyme)
VENHGFHASVHYVRHGRSIDVMQKMWDICSVTFWKNQKFSHDQKIKRNNYRTSPFINYEPRFDFQEVTQCYTVMYIPKRPIKHICISCLHLDTYIFEIFNHFQIWFDGGKYRTSDVFVKIILKKVLGWWLVKPFEKWNHVTRNNDSNSVTPYTLTNASCYS